MTEDLANRILYAIEDLIDQHIAVNEDPTYRSSWARQLIRQELIGLLEEV